MTKRKKQEWAVTLRDALRTWCEMRKIPPHTLARKLDIPHGLWRNIISGRSICKDPEIYARLYLHTNFELAEADPREIPPLVQRPPKAEEVKISRKWSEETWQAWLVKQQKKSPVPALTLPIKASLDDALRRLIHEIALEIVQTMQTGSGRSSASVADIGALADQLSDALRTYVKGSRADRDWLIKTYGSQLGRLVAIADPLTQKPDERERSIKGMLDSEEVLS